MGSFPPQLPFKNLADGTDGELITWGADGKIAAVAAGTSGQVLTSNGAGSAPTMQAAATASSDLSPDLFNGTGAQTIFTLSTAPDSAMVFIDGVFQQPSTYTIVTTTITFTGGAPASGTNNILVLKFVSLAIGTPSDNTVTEAKHNSGAATIGQSLQADGVGGASYENAGGGGAWMVKQSGTLTADTEFTVTGLTKTTMIYIEGVPSADGTTIALQTSANSGVSYDSGASDYVRTASGSKAISSAPLAESGENGNAYHGIQRIGNAAGESFSGYFRIDNPAEASRNTNISSRMGGSESTGDVFWQWNGAGQRKSAAIVDAVRVFPIGGTFTGTYTAIELN